MKNLVKYLIVVLVASIFSISAVAKPTNHQAKVTSHRYMFVQMAKSGMLVPDSSKPNTGELVLTQPSKYILTYTPNGKVQPKQIKISKFYNSRWDKGQQESFKNDPPNGVLTYSLPDAKRMQSIGMILSDPKLQANGNVVFHVASLDKHALPHANFNDSSLTLDNFPWPPHF